MATEENKNLVRHFYVGLNNGDIGGMMELVIDNALGHPFPPGIPQGSEGVKLVLKLYTDNSYTIEDMISEGDKVVTRFTNTSNQISEFRGLPVTGKPATKEGIDLFRIENGK